ncbi:uncharacterized protein ACO6RY_05930 [Pungitius sinensis]
MVSYLVRARLGRRGWTLGLRKPAGPPARRRGAAEREGGNSSGCRTPTLPPPRRLPSRSRFTGALSPPRSCFSCHIQDRTM